MTDGHLAAYYRVMTVSFHKYGDFFPGTGALGDVGYGAGRHYSVNIPLQEGIDDDSYAYVFEPVMQKARACIRGCVAACPACLLMSACLMTPAALLPL